MVAASASSVADVQGIKPLSSDIGSCSGNQTQAFSEPQNSRRITPAVCCYSMRYRKSMRRAVLGGVFLAWSVAGQPQPLDRTARLELRGDLAAQMVEGIHRYLDRATALSVESREQLWKRDYRSAERYSQSVAPNRDHLRTIIGAVDQRLPATGIRLDASTPEAPAIGAGSGYKIYLVRWPVFEGVDGEGVLLEPESRPVARIVAVPDADWPPEMLVGMAPGVDAGAQYARRLAENGCEVLV